MFRDVVTDLPALLGYVKLPPALVVVMIVIGVVASLAPTIMRLLGWRKPSQRRRERQARKTLATLAQIQEPGRRFALLRKMDPFTFEELILEAYERRGHKVKRNHRYTGDGGIDGRVWLNGELHLIQAKRYTGHISLAHVKAFSRMVQRKRCKGVFVHTGKTGRASRSVANADDRVSMISGQQLLAFLDVPKTPAESGSELPTA